MKKEDYDKEIETEELPKGEFYGGLGITFRNYSFFAYPGKEAVENGREHLPLHFHVKSPEEEYRVDCKTFKDRKGKTMPKDLRKFLRKNRLKIRARTLETFFNGRWN